ncbi:hypothetical protein KR51_00008030 [Rubidibacter lacunae KORDI 51-2]|uniref:Uncharacterized protein n=1 Tax=Rubidibacter lacunae KORDI 51-2 TaxID=582515 RepID=U5DPF9_9CHRO|nr:hypothetical protein KR51_00008030 [Rubidibacter lacunae KORDI 51-2]
MMSEGSCSRRTPQTLNGYRMRKARAFDWKQQLEEAIVAFLKAMNSSSLSMTSKLRAIGFSNRPVSLMGMLSRAVFQYLYRKQTSAARDRRHRPEP